jgi:hypothetical protein
VGLHGNTQLACLSVAGNNAVSAKQITTLEMHFLSFWLSNSLRIIAEAQGLPVLINENPQSLMAEGK